MNRISVAGGPTAPSTNLRNRSRMRGFFLPRVTPDDLPLTCNIDDPQHHQRNTPRETEPLERLRDTKDVRNLEKIQSAIVTGPAEKFSLVQPVPNEPSQFIGIGGIRAALATLSLPELQNIVAWLLNNNLIEYPANYDYWDMFKFENGGRDILLHELLKEDDDVLAKAYLLIGRLKPETQTKRNTTTRRRSHKGENADNDEEEDESDVITVVNRASNLVVPKIPTQTTLKDKRFFPVIPDGDRIFQSNVGVPYNDPAVYARIPVRKINDKPDGDVKAEPVDICSTASSAYLEKTANDSLRSSELTGYEDLRQDFAEHKRSVCEVRPKELQYLIDRKLSNIPLSTPRALTNFEKTRLKKLGWTDKDIERVGLDKGIKA